MMSLGNLNIDKQARTLQGGDMIRVEIRMKPEGLTPASAKREMDRLNALAREYNCARAPAFLAHDAHFYYSTPNSIYGVICFTSSEEAEEYHARVKSMPECMSASILPEPEHA